MALGQEDSQTQGWPCSIAQGQVRNRCTDEAMRASRTGRSSRSPEVSYLFIALWRAYTRERKFLVEETASTRPTGPSSFLKPIGCSACMRPSCHRRKQFAICNFSTRVIALDRLERTTYSAGARRQATNAQDHLFYDSGVTNPPKINRQGFLTILSSGIGGAIQ